MLKSPHGPLPRMQSLRAFEAAARHSSFVRAAEELGIHQPTVSRHVAELEREIGTRLFRRSHRSVTLTTSGEVYYRAVSDSLARIANAAVVATGMTDDHRVVIACGAATSELFLGPRFQALRQALGPDTVIHILRCEHGFYYRLNLMVIGKVDLLASYHHADGVPDDQIVCFPEAIAPVCSPDFAAAHGDTLRGPVAQWGALPFLDFERPTLGWATWEDWFEAVGYPQPPPRYQGYDDYVYMMDAAVAGQGLALGWRNFMGRHLDSGLLVTASDRFVEFDRALTVRLTERGCQRPLARRCLEFFASMAE